MMSTTTAGTCHVFLLELLLTWLEFRHSEGVEKDGCIGQDAWMGTGDDELGYPRASFQMSQ